MTELTQGPVVITRRPLGQLFEVAAWDDGSAPPAGETVLPIGRHRWLVIGEPASAANCSTVDVSGGFVCLAISGDLARDLLRAEITLDLAEFPPGRIAVTRLAETRVILAAEQGGVYALYVPASGQAAIESRLVEIAAGLGADVLIDISESLIPRPASMQALGLK